ncbi:MAG: glycosyltransferase family 4 protein [Coriobacteriia bacterium]|nr:glycosyltransferase family 4 protein [Coriobacteriia bacterium]
MSAARAGGLHIGVTGPMSLELLDWGADRPPDLPQGYPAPIISSIVNGLLRSGARVTAISASTGLAQAQVWESGPLTVIVVPRGRPRSAVTLFRRERDALRRALMKSRPDVISAHWTYEFAAAALDSGIPTLVTVRDHAPTILKARPDAYRLLRLMLSSQVLRRATHCSVTSPYMLDLMPAHLRQSTWVIPNFVGVDVERRAAEPRARVRRIVTVSNGFFGHKNIQAAIRAYALSSAMDCGMVYQLIGDQLGPGGPAQRWAESQGIAEGIEFVGRLSYSQTLDSVGAASMMIHPALEESFGMTVLEAMALGTPVIGGVASGNVPALLSEGCGVLCDVSSPQSISGALDGLIAQPIERGRVATQARARAEADYSSGRVIGLYSEALSAILAASRSVEGAP